METTDQDKTAPAADESAETERLKEELRREHDMYLRALADFDNYRKRVERDRSTASRAAASARSSFSLLDVLDDFDRALEHMSDAPPSVSEGCRRCSENSCGC